MGRIITDYDSFSGVAEQYKKDQMTGKIQITKTQDVSKIFSANAAEQNAIGNGNWKGDMHKVASIPLVVCEQWTNELKAMGAESTSPFHNSNRRFLIAKLNDYNNSKLRTKSGRL
ncbi:MAG: hypothetical protein K0U20_08385 [Proteobacteria bacterium]|nr:hypothetical protein [Pseudomonadota bacterium]